MEAQLRTDPLIQSEENQHASGTKNQLNLLTLFSGKRTHTHMANTKPSVDTRLPIYAVISANIHREIHTSTCTQAKKHVMYEVGLTF